MKKILLFFFCVLLLLLCSSAALAEDAPWKQAYGAILTESLTQWEQMRNDAAVENSYTLWDMDRDGVPELILKNGTCEADYVAHIYTFRDSRAARVDTIGAAHMSFYGYGENGSLIAYWGHMGYAQADGYRLADGNLTYEVLFEDNLFTRLEQDPDAYYFPVTDFIPSARPLTLVEADNTLMLEQYEAVSNLLDGRFSSHGESHFPGDDEGFFLKVISNDLPVYAAATDRYANVPGAVSFRELLRKDVATPWMSGDLEIQLIKTADLNSDGQLECILDLSGADGSNPMRFYLSEQDGTVYVYIENYAYNTQTVDKNGNLITVSSFEPDIPILYRLVFDRETSFLLSLPPVYALS